MSETSFRVCKLPIRQVVHKEFEESRQSEFRRNLINALLISDHEWTLPEFGNIRDFMFDRIIIFQNLLLGRLKPHRQMLQTGTASAFPG